MTDPQEPAGPRVAVVLEALVLQKVTGVLRIAGEPSGAIYLDRGHLAYAEASWSPGLSARVRGLPQAGEPDGDLGAVLLREKYLSKAGLRGVLKSIVTDALIVLTMPLPDETLVTGTRFEVLPPHWAGTYSALRLESVRPAAAKKAAVLARAGIGVTSPLESREPPSSRAVIKREHSELASRLDGKSSIREIAEEYGLSLHETIERIGYLVKKGMCAARTAASPPKAALPVPEIQFQQHPPYAPAADDDDAQSSPTAAELRRVLDGLRRLN